MSTSRHSSRPLKRMLSAAAAASLALTACTPWSPPHTPSDDPASAAATENPAQADGPHAAQDRPRAPRQVTRNEAGTVQRASVDLGNVTQGKYTAPLRGEVFVPTRAAKSSELVIVSHLRAPNCQDRTFSYPCASGVEEFRYDQGMSYLGEHLAERGYTVIIPDLGGIFIGSDLEEPYSQTAMWSESVRTLMDAIVSDAAGTSDILGLTYSAPVDMDSVGLFVHSRSGMVVDAADKLVGAGRLKSVFAYGPAYDTVELAHVSPAPADIPYLAVVGELDSDVGPSANLWLGHYASTPRQTPASVAELPGLGHMYINQAASAASFDDRVSCDLVECAPASEHERVVSEVATSWLDMTLRGENGDVPVHAGQPLPDTLGGLPARWLALSPAASGSGDAAVTTAAQGAPLRAVGSIEPTALSGHDDQATVCVNVDPMLPERPADACPEPETGLMQILTPVALVKSSAQATVEFQGLRAVAIHLAPAGVPTGLPGVPVTVTFTMADGRKFTHTIAGDHPALRNRFSEHDNGTYRLGTARFLVPPQVTEAELATIAVSAPSPVEVRSIDLLK